MISIRRKDQAIVPADAAQQLAQQLTTESQFALGTRSIVDLIAPGQIEFQYDHVIMDGRYARCIAVTSWPASVHLEWLDPLMMLRDTIDISIHIEPLDERHVMGMLDKQLTKLASEEMTQQKNGIIRSAEMDVQKRHIISLRDELASRQEKLFSVRLYVMIFAETLEKLTEVTRRVQSTMVGNCQGLQSRPLYLEQEAGLHAVLPEGYSPLDKPRWNINSSPLAASFPFSSGQISTPRGIYYGDDMQTQSMIIYDRFSGDNYNMVVLGETGKGKGYFVKTEAVQAVMAGIDYFIIDPDNEYGDLCTALGGQNIKISTNSGQHINPFDISGWEGLAENDENFDPLVEKVEHLHTIIDLMTSELSDGMPISTLTATDRAMIDRALYLLYKYKGFVKGDFSTYGRTPPLLPEFYRLLKHLAKTADNDRVAAQLEEIAERLYPYCSGTFSSLFSQHTNVDMNRRMVVFDVQSLEAQLRPIAMSVITNHIWSVVRKERKPRILLIDEIWSLLRHKASAQFITGTIKRARKYYLGVTCITQDVTDFLGEVHTRPISQNAHLIMLLGQKGTSVQLLREVFDLSEVEGDIISQTPPGEGLFMVGRKHVQIKVPYQPDEIHELITTNPAEREKIKRKKAAEAAGANDIIDLTA